MPFRQTSKLALNVALHGVITVNIVLGETLGSKGVPELSQHAVLKLFQGMNTGRV
jgi:hypothetical protein